MNGFYEYLMWLSVWEKEDFIIVLHDFIEMNLNMQVTVNSRCKYVGICVILSFDAGRGEI